MELVGTRKSLRLCGATEKYGCYAMPKHPTPDSWNGARRASSWVRRISLSYYLPFESLRLHRSPWFFRADPLYASWRLMSLMNPPNMKFVSVWVQKLLTIAMHSITGVSIICTSILIFYPLQISGVGCSQLLGVQVTWNTDPANGRFVDSRRLHFVDVKPGDWRAAPEQTPRLKPQP